MKPYVSNPADPAEDMNTPSELLPRGIISLLMSGNFFCLIANCTDRAHLVTKLMLVFLYSRPLKRKRGTWHWRLCRNQTLCLIAFGNNKEPPSSLASLSCPMTHVPVPSLCLSAHFQAMKWSMNNRHVQHVECRLGIGLSFHLSTLTFDTFDEWTTVTADIRL